MAGAAILFALQLRATPVKSHPIVELLGDGISAELSESVHRLAEALPFRLDFVPVDLSLESREARGDGVFDEAEDLMRRHKVGCLPVVEDGKLVGIVTEHDFIVVSQPLLERALRGQS